MLFKFNFTLFLTLHCNTNVKLYIMCYKTNEKEQKFGNEMSYYLASQRRIYLEEDDEK